MLTFSCFADLFPLRLELLLIQLLFLLFIGVDYELFLRYTLFYFLLLLSPDNYS